MNILHIDSSLSGADSVSRRLSHAVVAGLTANHPHAHVDRLDLDADPLPHLSAASLANADPAEASRAAGVLNDFLAADVVVIGAPMYNFSIPSSLKAWIDRIAIAGRTFRYTAAGPIGLAGGKRAILALSQGGEHRPGGPSDFQQRYLEFLLGFLGIDDIHVVRASGLALSAERREQAIAAALVEARRIAAIEPARLRAA